MNLTACTPSCASVNKLVVGKPLSPGDVIVSSDGTFALGFFSPSDSTPAKQYLGIWYNSIPKQLTVVWVANRETPIVVTGSSSSSATPTLALTHRRRAWWPGQTQQFFPAEHVSKLNRCLAILYQAE